MCYVDILPLLFTIFNFICLLLYFSVSLYSIAKVINLITTTKKLETVEEYNKAVDTKQDKYGKKPDTLEKKVLTGPFVAIEIAPGIHYTMGGVQINTDAQVIDNNGKPIPNFYAAGEVTGGVHGANRLGGNSISETVTFVVTVR